MPLTVDLVILTLRPSDLHVLLIERGIEPYQGEWALPGGFTSDPGEDVFDAACRELREEDDLEATGLHYRELQYDQPMPHFDKPDKLTVSGVHRGEQRALYGARRGTEIPAHGLRLVVIRPADLDADGRGRLRRTRESDVGAVRGLLASGSDEDRVTDAFDAG